MACAAAVLTMISSPIAFAASGGIEEVIVTAQRTEQGVQEVPIAVTALTGEMLEDRQVITPSDLQLNVPNVSFTSTNFGGSSFSIRGIGRLVISGSGENGVSTHINEIPIGTNLTAVEWYDVERVEVLRGPQGTLFGRNATGGAVNMVTKRPDFDSVGGFIDAEYGDYEHKRVKGAFNLPITENLAFRVAGMYLDRDGYIDNTADGQVGLDGTTLPGIDDDIDGRELYTYRVTGEWNITDRANLWGMYSKFHEDDDRARVTNQVCKRTELPTLGCEADEVGFDTPHLGTTTGGLFGGLSTLAPLQGALPLGSPGGNDDPNVVYNFPKSPTDNFRKMHTDFEPEYYYDENTWLGGINYDFDSYRVSLQGAYQETQYVARQDYNMDVGPNLEPVPGLNPEGFFPTSEVDGDYSSGFGPRDQCSYTEGTAGIFGGCQHPYAGTDRIFAFDHSSSKGETWNIEAKVASDYDGRFNFVLGASTYDTKSKGGDYYVNANTLDLVGTQGVPLLGFPRLYPTLFNVPGNPDQGTTSDGWASFGEAYFDVTDRIKFTVGLRYNDDTKKTSSTSVLYNALALQDITGQLPGVDDPYWTRNTGFLLGAPYDPALTDFYDATAEFEAASTTAALSPERFAADQLVPIVPLFNETRALTGSPDEADWQEWTGRVGLDWQYTDDNLVYLFYSQGYKPGGFNPPINPAFADTSAYTFENEEIGAIELGSKNTFLDGRLTLNGSVFYYDYSDLQVTRIANNSSLNDNIDAEIWGVEIEGFYSPEQLPGLQIDWAYSYLSAEVDGSSSVDPVNRTAGDPNFTVLQNIDPGSLTGVNYIAPTADVLPVVPAALADLGALSELNNTTVPGVTYDNGIPVYFSRNYLNAAGVATSDGLDSDLDGNSLPNSPENTFHLGAAYTWNIAAIRGSITTRWDYYWQDDSYAREFNTKGDEIDSWDQHNASMIYESDDGSWKVTAWVRNIGDEDNVTGKYLTSDTSGFYRNYFLTEPRVFGASVRYAFGEM